MAGAANAERRRIAERRRTLLATTEVSIRSSRFEAARSFSVIQMYYALRACSRSAGGRFVWRARMQPFAQRTPQDIARAIELEPENGEYLAALALQAEYSRAGFDAAVGGNCPAESARVRATNPSGLGRRAARRREPSRALASRSVLRRSPIRNALDAGEFLFPSRQAPTNSGPGCGRR